MPMLHELFGISNKHTPEQMAAAPRARPACSVRQHNAQGARQLKRFNALDITRCYYPMVRHIGIAQGIAAKREKNAAHIPSYA
jgi:hypothetical protein